MNDKIWRDGFWRANRLLRRAVPMEPFISRARNRRPLRWRQIRESNSD